MKRSATQGIVARILYGIVEPLRAFLQNSHAGACARGHVPVPCVDWAGFGPRLFIPFSFSFSARAKTILDNC